MWRVREAADSIIPVSPESYETLIKGLKLEDADHHPKVGGYTAPHWKVFFSNHVNNEIRLVNFKIHFISRPTVEVLSDIRVSIWHILQMVHLKSKSESCHGPSKPPMLAKVPG